MDSVMEYYSQVDAVVSEWIYRGYDQLGWDLRFTTPVTENWPLVASPTPCFLLLAKYLLVVLVCYGYQKMFPSEKKPDGPVLRAFVQIHNLFLAGLSLWMGVSMIYYVFANGYRFWGMAYDPVRDQGIAWVMYVFYLSKFWEFFDTYIMLFKGNLKQVSFLHVYHHISTAIIFWMVSKVAPGGDAYFCITLNCWVHVVMYSYYFLTTIIKAPEARKTYLWWGKYLTQFQMSQFLFNLIHAGYCFHNSDYWIAGKWMQAIDMTILLGFFGNFYVQKYHAKPAKTDVTKTKKMN